MGMKEKMAKLKTNAKSLAPFGKKDKKILKLTKESDKLVKECHEMLMLIKSKEQGASIDLKRIGTDYVKDIGSLDKPQRYCKEITVVKKLLTNVMALQKKLDSKFKKCTEIQKKTQALAKKIK